MDENENIIQIISIAYFMNTNLKKNKVVLITGSSRGIGASLANYFATNKYYTVINYSKSKNEAEKLYDNISKIIDKKYLLLCKADVSIRNDVKQMFKKIINVFGKLDILINNAGLNIDKPFLKLTDDDWQKVLQINLTGTFICSQEFALHFGKRRNGHIINFGAHTGITGRMNGANYCSSKSGVLTLTKCLAQELSPSITVNCIVPGHIATEEVISRYKLSNKKSFTQEIQKIPMGRLGRTNDVCNLVDYIINKSTFSTGHKFFVDGGMFMH